MKAAVNWLVLAYFSGGVASLYLAIIFLGVKKGNKWTNLIFSLFLFKFAYAFFISFLYYSGIYEQFPYIVMTKEPLRLTFGPLVFLYVVTLTARRYSFSCRDLLHFIPFMFFTVILIPVYFFHGENIPLFIRDYKNFNSTYVYFLFIFKSGQDLIYIGLVRRKLLLYRGDLKNEFSTIDRINFSWISNLLYAYILVIMVYIGMSLLFWMIKPESQNVVVDIVNILIILFVLVFGYMGLTREYLLSDFSLDEGKPKYERSSLTEKTTLEYGNQLIAFLEETGCYRDSSLTLKKLGDKLSLSPHNLSQVINQELNKNFYELVNYYRIEEAKKRLRESGCRDMKIMEILLDCGFKSKSVFNTLFKENTGMTPTQFRRKRGRE